MRSAVGIFSIHAGEDVNEKGVEMCSHDNHLHHHERHQHACCGAHHEPCSPAPTVDHAGLAGGHTYYIQAMDCAVEEGEIRQALSGISGIRGLRFHLGARTLTIDATEDALALALEAIGRAGFNPQSLSSNSDGSISAHTPPIKRELMRLILGLALAFFSEGLAYFAPDTLAYRGIGMVIAGVAISLSGFSTYKKGLIALRYLRLNINALMTVAVTGAFLIGQWPEAAMVMALYAIAEVIEARSVDRARNAVRDLLALSPNVAEVFNAAHGHWHAEPAEEVALESIVRVKPGERVPLDGIVTSGSSTINQAPITGESIPVEKNIGDPVFAGTINETATLEFRTTATASNTTLARIIHTIEEAHNSRAPMHRMVDRFASIYTPAVFVMALLVALVTPWFLGWSWGQSVYKALVMLVISCPCALVISTPVTVVSGLTNAARRGILIKGGVYLEEARNLRVVAMDKTGTITEGQPRLIATEILSSGNNAHQIRQWAASVAAHSGHPVSQAIARDLDGALLQPGSFTAIAGRGVSARIGGSKLVLGNHALIHELGLCSPEIEVRLQAHESQGRTVALLASEEMGVLAIFAVADTIRMDSIEAVKALHELGLASALLSGDNQITTQAIGSQVNIDDARGNLLPEEKLEAIEKLEMRYGPSAMVGDGINDGPALAKAHIGIAMGGAGTDTAMESADVVIMNDDLRRVADMISLSRKTHQVLWQNIILALGIKAVFMILAVMGMATMWMAVFADTGASLLVVANGLRMLRMKPFSGP